MALASDHAWIAPIFTLPEAAATTSTTTAAAAAAAAVAVAFKSTSGGGGGSTASTGVIIDDGRDDVLHLPLDFPWPMVAESTTFAAIWLMAVVGNVLITCTLLRRGLLAQPSNR